ncbi:respiratory nitrate reductase chaperone NarJ [Melghirimyces thermohalophilus]|uniref:Respiratory nitrate reductase chaperone NarJ n=1 Tax=Melghirimyces thermohalophilus TaxID=1236220 RepID=A0A1G6PPQ4_9BACL|nr:nitrate reductase molybdenum cofactor assembly chaperone [Melghirimyces thermohalophilus]SDC81624.1 respiratory nitrate reductase chaperone NarJ [Melghirimyces thermohalophilus]
METLQNRLRLISFLLQYPEEGWKKMVGDLRRAIDPFEDPIAPYILRFAEFVDEEGIEAMQIRYVQTFDFGKKTHLYLTYARHGEQRERGSALLALKQVYAQNGFQMVEGELPDYLPLMLEFASVARLDSGMALLREYRPAIQDIQEHLTKMDSPYVAIFDALLFILDQQGIQSIAEEEAP